MTCDSPLLCDMCEDFIGCSHDCVSCKNYNLLKQTISAIAKVFLKNNVDKEEVPAILEYVEDYFDREFLTNREGRKGNIFKMIIKDLDE